MVPGGVQTGAPLRMPGPFPGTMPPGLGLNPPDPYLPCSSRHFLTRHATNILNSASNNQQVCVGPNSLLNGVFTTIL